jgi:hypothetical protein
VAAGVEFPLSKQLCGSVQIDDELSESSDEVLSFVSTKKKNKKKKKKKKKQ